MIWRGAGAERGARQTCSGANDWSMVHLDIVDQFADQFYGHVFCAAREIGAARDIRRRTRHVLPPKSKSFKPTAETTAYTVRTHTMDAQA